MILSVNGHPAKQARFRSLLESYAHGLDEQGIKNEVLRLGEIHFDRSNLPMR